MKSEQVLRHYNPHLPIRISCDASPFGLGAVLSHVCASIEERPIAFAIRTLNSAENNYSQIDKEAVGIVLGIKHFQMYLYGRHFSLITDHKPLVSIFHPHKCIPLITTASLQRYTVFLSGLDYSIEYRNTKKHGYADGLTFTISVNTYDQPRRRVRGAWLSTCIPHVTARGPTCIS